MTLDVFTLDLEDLIRIHIRRRGGGDEEFKKIIELVDEYSTKANMPWDGIALIVVDCLSSGMQREGIETQLRVYDSKRTGAITA